MNAKAKAAEGGFSLMELLVTVAIIAILLGVGLPVYNNYTAKAKFSEIIQAVAPYKTAADMAVQLGAADIAELDSGSNGIPSGIGADNSYYKYVASINVNDGVISAQARDINADDEPTYILKSTIVNGLLEWSLDTSSTCLAQALCSE